MNKILKRKKILTITAATLTLILLASISVDLFYGRALPEASQEACCGCGSTSLSRDASQEPSGIYKSSLTRDARQEPCTIMKPDLETRKKWVELYNEAPRAYIEPELKAEVESFTGTYTLLDHLDYDPVERDQASCGNCWAWAGTGVLGIALDVQRGIKDRLSVQYITSCFDGGTGSNWACCGGWLSDLAYFYSGTGFAVPWSNTEAHWQDGGRTCSDAATTVPCGTISTSPNYPISAITEETIDTHEVGQATAISNIKNILHQDRAVWFGYFLPDFGIFHSFWWDELADDIWNPDSSCGQTWTDDGGGHAVLCVGYNDDDPDNSYWIMVNSWGTAGGDRPNGIFRLDMDMNYDCTHYDSGWFYSFYWQTLDVTFTQEDHDIIVNSLEASPILPLGDSTIINGTIANGGLNDEVDVEVQFLVNGTVTDTTSILSLPAETSTDVEFPWTPTIEGTYNVTIYAVPVSGEVVTSNNWLYDYTSVMDIPTVDVLIVSDDDGIALASGTSSDEFAAVLDAHDLSYFMWNESSLGNPSLSVLERFELVIWTCGDYFFEAVDATDAVTLQQYLTQGGSILLEGEEIGYDHGADDFMVNVAHAEYEIDDTDADGLNVTDPDHPVTTDLPSSFLWATDPPYADGVSPVAGGAEVIQYNDTSYSAVIVFGSGGSGSVVYMAFPLYCVDSPEQETLAINSVNWLRGDQVYDLSTFPEPFVMDELLNFTMIIAETGPHGAFGAGALTIDVYSAVILGEALGMHATTGSPECVMDTWVSTYNSGTGRVEVLNLDDNLITIAGYGVNLITYEYFTDFVAAFSGSRTPLAPVYLNREWDANPANVRTWIMFPGQPLTYSDWDIQSGSTDYSLIEIVYDEQNGRYILCVNSFTAQGTDAGCRVLAAILTGETLPFTLQGQAALLKWTDANADGKVQLTEVSLIETYP